MRPRQERVLQEAPTAPMPYHVHRPDAIDVRPEIRDDAPAVAFTRGVDLLTPADDCRRAAIGEAKRAARIAKKKGPLA